MAAVVNNNLISLGGVGRSLTPSRGAPAESASSADFAEALKQRIDEVAKLQQDASSAVDKVMTGRSEDVSGVMTAVEKSDLAFKTLLAIRSKLMDAYDEIKNMQV